MDSNAIYCMFLCLTLHLQVMCRFRPLNKSEVAAGSSKIMKFPPNSGITKYYGFVRAPLIWNLR